VHASNVSLGLKLSEFPLVGAPPLMLRAFRSNGLLSDCDIESRRGNRARRRSCEARDAIATDQLTVFGELLVVLARQLDGAQQTVKRLTWVLTALTAFLVIEAVVRYFSH
jgi:hypothetical protein